MAAYDIPKGTGSSSGSTSQDSMSKSPRPSPPSTRREMYISFNHLHKNLSSFVEEPESEEEEYLPKKKEPWRKRQIPDYRKVKIGEYYNDTPVESKPAATDCSGGESDKSARSSFDSDINTEAEETHHVKPHTQTTCSGCATVFAPVAHKHTPRLSADSYEFAKMRYMAAQKGLKIETKVKENEKYRCNWPGCRMVFCKPCAVLMKTPKASGGVGGNLKDLKDLLALRRQAQASVEESSTPSQEPTNALNCKKETPHVTTFLPGGKSVDRVVTKIITNNQDKTQANLAQKEESGMRNNQLDVSVGIVVTVKELGYLRKI